MKTLNLFYSVTFCPIWVLLCLFASTSDLLAQITITNIPSLGGSLQLPTAINNSGSVVGSARTPGDDDEHAFLFNGGVTYDLGGYFSRAFGINAAGQICGYSTVTNNLEPEPHAFTFALGGNTDLGTLGGSTSIANAINDLGQIAGTSTIPEGLPRAFILSGGTMTNLGTLGGSSSFAAAVNDAGQVAGESSATNGESHAFLYSGGVMTDLGTLGGSSSSAFFINSVGQVAGDAETTNHQSHGFFYSAGAMHDVGTFGGTFSTANGMNEAGQVVGEATTTNDFQTHAFLYSAGVLTDLGTLGNSSRAAAINNQGQIIGTSTDVQGNSVPFLWQNGAMSNLNALLPPNSGWVLHTADLLNEAGQIVGLGTFKGSSSSFLLSLPGRRPPVANAGPDQTVECSTTVMLNGSGSTSPDGRLLTYEWRTNNILLATGVTPSVSLGLGSHIIVLTVTDSQAATAQAIVTINIADRTPPTLTCPESLTVSAGSDSQVMVPDILSGATANDNCTPAAGLLKTQTPAAGTLVGIGSYDITITVTDASRNSTTCTTSFMVQAESDKITICHKGKIRITVSSKALAAHLAHGDSIGSCSGEGP